MRERDPLVRINEDAGNQLLGALPDQERATIVTRATPMRVETEGVLQRPDQRCARVFFPTTAVISVLTTLHDGSMVETATIGREGMVGVALFLGDDLSPNGAAVAQMAGEVMAVDADAFRAALADSEKLRQRLSDYTRALMLQISQGVACGVVHGVQQRLSRWLLQTSDRIVADEVKLTHQFLAEILHVRRASITDAARALHRAGAIDVRRGAMLIVDRPALEAASCECYGFVRAQYRRLVDS
jgi:CRP-like cAMP-binding protein